MLKNTACYEGLPPADSLLYNKLENLARKSSSNKPINSHDLYLITNKLLYIINALIIRYYGQPVFKSSFIPMERGPVDDIFQKIQRKKRDVSSKEEISAMVDKDDMKVYTRIVENVFNAVEEAVEKNIFKLEPTQLSHATHTLEWRIKYHYTSKKNKRLNDSNIQSRVRMSDRDILKFANTSLKYYYKDLVKYVDEYLDAI